MINNCIITPTYINHFQYIPLYLKSFKRYVIDKENVEIAFIVEKRDIDCFKRIIYSYTKGINYKIVAFEDLLDEFGIKEKPDELMKLYGRYTYQTLKKIYAMLGLNYERFLILDSESMWIRKTRVKKLFDDFFNNPFVIGSTISIRKATHPLIRTIVENSNLVLHSDEEDKWFIESFMWFIEKKILKQLVKEKGEPIEWAKQVKEKSEIEDINPSGIMEADLILRYIYINKDKFGYRFVLADDELKEIFNREEEEDYLSRQANLFYGGVGILEYTPLLLTRKNCNKLSELFQKNKIKIVRCEYSNIFNYRLQNVFMSIVKPNILATSQESWFGLRRKKFFEYTIEMIRKMLWGRM